MEALRSLPRNLRILIALFVAVLVARFFWSFMVYPVPLGYDTGIYRTLFLLHAEGWPPFATAALPGWAKAHDIGLFILSTPLLRLGIPVDWLIGWIWNAFPVFLACVLAWVTVKREGAAVGAVVLLLCALSLPYYDGFWVMYYKVYVSLLWMVLTLHFLDRGSWWAVVPGLLTLVTHRQTGLLLTLVVLVWCAQLAESCMEVRNGCRNCPLPARSLRLPTLMEIHCERRSPQAHDTGGF